MRSIDLSEIPHEWAKGTVVIIVYPKEGAALCVTLMPERAEDAELAFRGLRAATAVT